MKLEKSLFVCLMLVVSLSLFGCTPNEQTTSPGSSQPVVDQQESEESKYPFPDSVAPMGNGKLVIETQSGTSEEGNIPVIFVNEGTLFTQIGEERFDWEGDKEVFFYIDKVFVEAKQGGERSAGSLDIEDDFLSPGIHIVSAIQYENNDPNGKVIGYQEAKFEIKRGS